MTQFYISPRRSQVARMMDRMMDDTSRHSAHCCTNDSFVPRVDVFETDDNYRLVFEVPGIDKNDIKVWVEDGVLTVSGKRPTPEHDEKVQHIRNEIASGEFSRAFTLPDGLDAEKISADYKNGLLTVTLAKAEEKKPREVQVNIA